MEPVNLLRHMLHSYVYGKPGEAQYWAEEMYKHGYREGFLCDLRKLDNELSDLLVELAVERVLYPRKTLSTQ